MLVNRNNFEECLNQLLCECVEEKFVATDTETTALFWWNSPHYAIKPRVFSAQFSTAKTDYYFDFGCEETMKASPMLALSEEHFWRFQNLFGRKDLTWFIHNAKFDMHHYYNHGLYLSGTVHCTQAIARVVNNLESEKGFSLDALSEKYLGANKIDLSSYWKPDGNRVSKVKKPGENGKFYDFLHFDKLPLNILVEYGERDTRLCYRLGKWQLEQIENLDKRYFSLVPSNFGGSLTAVLNNERTLTKQLFWMERRGILLDMPFIKAAHAHACAGIKAVLTEIDEVAKPYVAQYNAAQTKESDKMERMDWNSGPQLKGLFGFLNIPSYKFTEKGNMSFDRDALESMGNPLAAKILEYRRHHKRAHTYLENYLWFGDSNDVLHCFVAQGGADTGRMSIRDPSMQNVPKRADKKETDFVLRKCFIPRPGKLLVSKDCDQAEYRLMLDYARESALINRILNDGLNVHEATQAELNFDDYDDAKTMNFKILYGSGLAAITYELFNVTVTLEELQAICKLKIYKMNRYDGYDKDRATVAALEPGLLIENVQFLRQGQDKMDLYFSKLPNVQKFIKAVRKKAKDEGVIFTWLGRVLRYDVKNQWGRVDDYKAPNGLCQGGVGELGKVQVNCAQEFFQQASKPTGDMNIPTLSGVVLHVHDELLSEIDITETHLIPELLPKLEKCYPHRLIPITVGCAWSKNSWGELTDGLP